MGLHICILDRVKSISSIFWCILRVFSDSDFIFSEDVAQNGEDGYFYEKEKSGSNWLSVGTDFRLHKVNPQEYATDV